MKKSVEKIKNNSLTAVVFGMWVRDIVEIFQELFNAYKNIKDDREKNQSERFLILKKVCKK
ncbi:hypothetical protein OVA29_21725 [Exiguobacterium sp. SL14]|nr:hypothetical protein [Exiguobacterium sp. SL14]